MVLIVRVLIAVPKNHSIGLWINAVFAAGVRDVCKYVSMYVCMYAQHEGRQHLRDSRLLLHGAGSLLKADNRDRRQSASNMRRVQCFWTRRDFLFGIR